MIKILIVEDERLIALDIKFMLERYGIDKVDITNSGERAIELSEQRSYDLVIMDISLYGSLNGINAARIILERTGTPILFCSAHTDKETQREISKLEPIGFLEKPVEERELEEVIRKFILTKSVEYPKLKYKI